MRALAEVVGYARWLEQPEAELDPAEEEAVTGIDARGARRFVTQLLMDHPGGKDLDPTELGELLGYYGVELWDSLAVTSEDEAVDAGERLGWPVVLKATAEFLRQSPDTAHVWRNIEDAEEMAHAWSALADTLENPDQPAYVVQRVARAGVPVSMAGMEDPLFGPVLSFGVSGAVTDLLGDRVYRIPPMTPTDAAQMVREIKAAPLLFGYRGGEEVSTGEVERLLLRLADLKNDLPQVRSLDLSLVLASAEGASVLTARARVEEVIDPRSEWFARRLSTMPGDTLTGGSGDS